MLLPVGGDGSGAFVRIRTLGVDALAVRVSGRCDTVDCYEVVAVVVTIDLLGFQHCAGDSSDTGSVNNHFCHLCSARVRQIGATDAAWRHGAHYRLRSSTEILLRIISFE